MYLLAGAVVREPDLELVEELPATVVTELMPVRAKSAGQI
jgi:hypothetical protein